MNKKYTYLIIILLIVASFIAYGRILGNDFVSYDDGRLITENIHIQSGINAESLRWALTNSRLEYWHPLTWISIMLHWRLFGANASGYHLVSLILHIGAVLFLFLFLNKATKNLWPSAFAAAFFALHPLRVESVAWAAEHKDVLSMFFGMATLYAYAYYAEKPGIAKYIICLILFALSLMSKPTLVTLPCVLLLLDYWPLERWREQLMPVNVPVAAVRQKPDKKRGKKYKADSAMEKKTVIPVKSRSQIIANLLLEKAPFFFLALALSIMLILQLRADSYMVSLQDLPLSERIMTALSSYVSYLGKIFWPSDLAVFYPYERSFQSWQVLGAALLLSGISIAVAFLAKKTAFLAIGWFWYLGTLFPLIGLLQNGGQSMADRYTYFPSIGISIMLTWGIVGLLPKENLRKMILFPTAGIVIFVLTILTWQQCGYWKNSIELYSHTLKVTKNNHLAHTNLGEALRVVGKNEEAIAHYREAIKIKPDDELAHYDLANVLAERGKIEEAVSHYREAIRINPYNCNALNNLGVNLVKLRQYDEAILHYRQALQIEPNDAELHLNLGIALAEKGSLKEAIAEFREAIHLNPGYENARRILRMVLESEQRQRR